MKGKQTRTNSGLHTSQMKSFSDIFVDNTKYCTKIKTDEYYEKGKYIIIDQGQADIAGYTDLENGVFYDVPALIFGDHTRIIKYVDKPFFIGADGVKVLKSTYENANYKYLYYALKNEKIPDTGYNRHFKWLKQIKIKYPSKEKQDQIVTTLDTLQSIINHRKQQLEKLDELVKARFVEMFGDPVLNPKSWNMAKIGDIVTEVKYGTSRPAVDDGKYPYLRMNNLTYDGHLDLTDLKRIDIPDDEIEKCIVRKGDVLFNRTNSVELVGKTCVFDEDEEMIIAGYIIRVRLKPVMLPIVLSNFMNTDALKKKLRNMAKGAVNQANINAQELQSISIYLPPLALQEQFAAFVEKTDKSKVVIETILSIIRRVKIYDQF